MRNWIAKFALLALFLSAPAALLAQGITTGTIAGTVLDPTGAVLVGAHVKAVNSATGTSVTFPSGGDGSYSLRDLPIGSYTVTISANGFSDLEVGNVLVTAGGINALGKRTLIVGSNNLHVEVDAALPLLPTTEAQVSEVFDAVQLQNLPLNSGFDEVALLVPGTVQTHDNSFSNNNGASFSSNGTRGRDNNFELDGQSNNDNSVAGPQIFFGNQDAIAELQVITNNFSAQYGRNSGSVINYITKSGTNTFHGTAFEFYQGSTFESLENSQKNPQLGYCAAGESAAATGCVPAIVPRNVENRFGGTLGGPILKDKLWAFGSAFFDRSHNGGGLQLSGTALTPNPAGLQQLAAAFPNNPGVAALVNNGPFSIKTGNPQAYGEVVNQSVTVNGTTISVPFQGISRGVPAQSNDEEVMGKLDWQPTSKDHLFARYFYQTNPNLNAGGSVPAGNWYNVPGTTHSIGADWTHTFSTQWIDQLRYSFQQSTVAFEGGAISNCTISNPGVCTSSININGNFADSAGNGFTNLGYGYADNIPQGRVVKVTQVQDNATWSKGKHSILFGGEWDYQNSPNGFLPNYAGTFNYNDFGSVLSGATTLNLTDGSYTIPFKEYDSALYFQDDWKATSRLTLNLGLRWEYFGQAVNLLHNETVARESNPATAFWDQSLPLSERTVPSAQTNWKNFEPRIGFAYNPEFNSKLVIRGGFAISFDPAFYNLFLDMADGAPVANAGTIDCDGVTVICQAAGGASGSLTRGLDLPLIPRGTNPNTRNETSVASNFSNPYTESWNLGIGYQLGKNFVLDIHYAGNHVVKNFQSLNGNPDLTAAAAVYPNVVSPSLFCSDATTVGVGHVNCNRTNVRQWGNTAFSNYNALQIKAETREFHGFTGTVNYTFSRAIDNASEVFSTFAGGNSITFAQNPLDTNVAERGVSGISIPNVVSVEAAYKLPFYREEKEGSLLSRVLGGFQLNGIYQHDDGQPATPYQTISNQWTEDSSLCDSTFNASFIGYGLDSCRPILYNPKAPIDSVGYYYSAADLAAGAPGGTAVGWYDYRTGNAIAGPSAAHWLHNDSTVLAAIGSTTPFAGVGRSVLRATNFSKLDVSLYKTTKIAEHVSLQLQFTAFNVLNQQYYGTPDPEIEDPSFQQTYNNTGSNRQLQLGGKIIF